MGEHNTGEMASIVVPYPYKFENNTLYREMEVITEKGIKEEWKEVGSSWQDGGLATQEQVDQAISSIEESRGLRLV